MRFVTIPTMLAASLCLNLYLAMASPIPEQDTSDHPEADAWHDTWVIHVPGGLEEAQQVASLHGFEVLRQVGSLENYFHIRHVCNDTVPCVTRRRRSDEHTSRLQDDHRVHWAEQQKLLIRSRRDSMSEADVQSYAEHIPDPEFSNQWYLYQKNGFHHNVIPVWNDGITGKGVVVTVVDDGIEHDHPDLKENYDKLASTDLNDNDDDAYPRESDPINKHGTRCCGQVAASKNSVCGIGVAYHANIGGIRMLDGPITDAVEAGSLGLRPQHVDIYSNSWGPNDDGRTVEGPGPLARKAMEEGVSKGRGGKGSIFIFASGNGGRYSDNCNCDGYTNSIYTISIGATTEVGKVPWYTEQCASTIAVAYSSGNSGQRAITTVDLHHGCTHSHTGTSAAAPLAAGFAALLLEANPDLTWRDVQHIFIRSADVTDEGDSDWVTNKAGFKVNHKFGFGVINAKKMIDLAKSWELVGQQIVTNTKTTDVNKPIPFGAGMLDSVTTTIDIKAGDTDIRNLEHVQIYVKASASARGDLAIDLVAPSGTKSMLLSRRPSDHYSSGLDWTFMSVRHWGESPIGTWTLYVRNAGSYSHSGTLLKWSLTLYGTSGSSQDCTTGTYEHAGDCLPCHDQCTSAGCDGPGPTNCRDCQHFVHAGKCVAKCEEVDMLDPEDGSNVCQPCDDECRGGCFGNTPSQCKQCQHVARVAGDTTTCVASCSDDEYQDENDVCQPCDELCYGCTSGGSAGCKECRAFQTSDGNCVKTCPPGETPVLDEGRCVICHAQCDDNEGCTGPTALDCVKCKNAFVKVQTDQDQSSKVKHECVGDCPQGRQLDASSKECVCQPGTYAVHNTLECLPCSDTCTVCTGPTAEDCLSDCTVAQYQDSCVEDCPEMTFPSNDTEVWQYSHPQYVLKSSVVCQECSRQCAHGCTGMTPQDCIKGPDGRQCASFRAPDGACVSACPHNTFPSASTELCQPCDEQCDGCNGPKNTDCDACQNVVFNGQCLPECPEKTYRSISDDCLPCHELCGSVCFGPSNKECYSSKEEATSGSLPDCKQLVANNNTCVASCPKGQYHLAEGASTSNLCKTCHSECSTEAACHESTAYDCGKCKHFADSEGKCVRSCQSSEFPDLDTMSCIPCHPSCGSAGCTGPESDDCNSAPCDKECPIGQQVTSDCRCEEVKCPDLYDVDGACVTSCSDGSYPDEHDHCTPCHDSCDTCIGPDASQCTECPSFAVPEPVPDRGPQTATCVDNCPHGTYPDANDRCLPCDDECDGCSGPSNADCMSCKNVLHQEECLADCPENTFDSEGNCLSCHIECVGGCTGVNPTDCAVCKHVMYHGECLSSCPSGTYPSQGSCVECDSNCLDECSGPGPTDCRACKDLLIPDTGECVSSCPESLYPTPAGKCKPCDSSCKHGCVGPSADECIGLSTTRPAAITKTTTAAARTTTRQRPSSSSTTAARGPAESSTQDTATEPSQPGSSNNTRTVVAITVTMLIVAVAATIGLVRFWRMRKGLRTPTYETLGFSIDDDSDEEEDVLIVADGY